MGVDREPRDGATPGRRLGEGGRAGEKPHRNHNALARKRRAPPERLAARAVRTHSWRGWRVFADPAGHPFCLCSS
ncbi:VOC family protein [Streptomyces sp. NPDC001070]